ncbi:DUF262 domain-containing protein [Ureaplasma sp. ES3154-GEN]|uniref:DUF262 domain-containing protein n=1 Tax=Ureaplasma sp. ES3154-GEN TaxID=2984844 RepID=UPI0021E7C568|nr:DUF262 domain-containing protein [Ureaplasma sp. ES3154-GEN]MCV3743364.1 DUF262 domain-containing protein [Ureaplasma sp. ES3154-GEN]
MAYEDPLTIKEVVDNIKSGKYFLPAIQREFVWDTKQIEILFNSIMREYPIGWFLFWKIKKENTGNYKFYKFLEYYHERKKTHNEKVSINGEKEITAILDGQQRLTSIYIALKGSYSKKLRNKQPDKDDTYPETKLYLNLIPKSDQKTEDNDFENNFKFLTEENANKKDENNYWYWVGDILDVDEEKGIENHLLEKKDIFANYKEETKEKCRETLRKLYKLIHTEKLISYYITDSESLDKVLDIFIRLNSGGTVLSDSDLLLSKVTAQWKKKDARELMINFVNEINRIDNSDHIGFNFDKDFVLKASLVMNNFPNIKYKVDNFNETNTEKMENNWDDVTKAIRIAVELVSSFGYTKETLTSKNAIIPIAYYLYKIKANENYFTSYKNWKDKNKIKKYLVLALTKKLFGGHSDSVLTTIRNIIDKNNTEFPLEQIIEKFKNSNKTLLFTDDEIREYTKEKYGKGFTFSLLSLLYPNLNYRNRFHIDHIFPKSLFTEKNLHEEGFNEKDIDTYLENFNCLPNLQLLEAVPNKEKNDKEFKVWLEEIYPGDTEKQAKFKKDNYIPDVNLDFENFIEFFNKRKELIIEKLKEILQDTNIK